MWHGVIAAVNLHISSHAAVFVGLGGSMWTSLSGKMLLPSAAAAHEWVSIGCNGTRGGLVAGTSLIPYDAALAPKLAAAMEAAANEKPPLLYAGIAAPPASASVARRRQGCRIRVARRSCVTCSR